ncbi:hypothetical protein ANN_17302 [Periplaneta americana]|uniref:Transposase n=1 Tax=Periplaneta americana TaxID=6978 RepID=A0ABQ8STZ2_PERAM|nr:hypothetical protein ANN_17302 [Periplaneta americana]
MSMSVQTYVLNAGVCSTNDLHLTLLHWVVYSAIPSSSRWNLRRSNCIGITVLPHIWCGIVGNQLLGPRVLPPRLNGEIYRAFLERELNGLLHDIPLGTRVNLWFMHDGAPAHYCRNASAYLNAVYPDERIGRAGSTPWPARSPDVNPLDFYLWGRLKSLVYASGVLNVEVLQQRIEHVCGIVRDELNGLCNVQRSLKRRAQKGMWRLNLSKHTILHIYLLKDVIFIGEAYVATLKKLQARMSRVRPHRVKQDVLLLHDNARSHVSHRTTGQIRKFG